MRGALGLIFVVGCLGPDRVEIDLSDRADVVAFAVTLDEDDVPLRATKPFVVVDGALEEGNAADLELRPVERTVVLVEVAHERLAEIHPEYVRSRTGELEATTNTPPVDFRFPSAGVKEVPLPTDARIFSQDEELAGESVARAVRGGVSLLLPVDREHCRPTSERFVPYAATGEILSVETGTAARELREVFFAGEQLMVLSSRRLHLVERGQNVQLVGPGTIGIATFLGRGASGVTFSAAADPSQPGRIVVSILFDDPNRSLLAEVQVNDGTLTHTGTVAVLPGAVRQIRFSDRGEMVAVTRDGRVWLERAGVLTAFELPDLPVDDPRSTAVSWGLPDQIVIGSSGRVHDFDPLDGSFNVYDVLDSTENAIELEGVAAGPSGDQWIVGMTGSIFSLAEDKLQPVRPLPPPRYTACAEGAPDRFLHDVQDVVVTDTHLFGVLEHCSAVMAMRLEDACMSIHPVGFDEPQMANDDELQALATNGREVVVVGQGARVYSLPLP